MRKWLFLESRRLGIFSASGYKGKRATEVMIRFANLGGNWNNGSESGSRNVNSNNADNSNTNNGSRGVCDDLQALCTYHKAVQADHNRWSAWLSSFGKQTTGSGNLRSSLERNAAPAFIYGTEAQAPVRPHHRQGQLSGCVPKNPQKQAQVDELSGVQRIRGAQSGVAQAGSRRRGLSTGRVSQLLHSRPKAKAHIRAAVSRSNCATRAQQYIRTDIPAALSAVHIRLFAEQGHARRSEVHPIGAEKGQNNPLSQDRLQQIFSIGTLPDALQNTRRQNL